MAGSKLTFTGARMSSNDCLNQMAFGGGGSSFGIPMADYQSFTYYGATNNIHVQTFKTGGSGGTTVGTLTFAYSGGGAANDDLITSITRT